jgi:hypothetical protein
VVDARIIYGAGHWAGKLVRASGSATRRHRQGTYVTTPWALPLGWPPSSSSCSAGRGGRKRRYRSLSPPPSTSPGPQPRRPETSLCGNRWRQRPISAMDPARLRGHESSPVAPQFQRGRLCPTSSHFASSGSLTTHL